MLISDEVIFVFHSPNSSFFWGGLFYLLFCFIVFYVKAKENMTSFALLCHFFPYNLYLDVCLWGLVIAFSRQVALCVFLAKC